MWLGSGSSVWSGALDDLGTTTPPPPWEGVAEKRAVSLRTDVGYILHTPIQGARKTGGGLPAGAPGADLSGNHGIIAIFPLPDNEKTARKQLLSYFWAVSCFDWCLLPALLAWLYMASSVGLRIDRP